EFYFFIGTYHKHSAHRCIGCSRSALRSARFIRWQHIVEFCDSQVTIPDHGIIRGKPLRFQNVLGPLRVALDRVYAKANDLAVSFSEFWLQFSHISQLGCTRRCEILGMRKKNGPSIANPFVETDGALGCFGFEIWRDFV